MILKPDLEDDAKNAVLDGFKAILTEGEGVVDNVDTEKLGLRELAYEIKDYTKGLYVVIDTHTTQKQSLNSNVYHVSTQAYYVT